MVFMRMGMYDVIDIDLFCLEQFRHDPLHGQAVLRGGPLDVIREIGIGKDNCPGRRLERKTGLSKPEDGQTAWCNLGFLNPLGQILYLGAPSNRILVQTARNPAMQELDFKAGCRWIAPQR